MVYRIEQKLGEDFLRTKALRALPVNEYFGGLIRCKPVSIFRRP